MLQQLAAYAAARLTDSEPGFKSREVRWSIELTRAGGFVSVIPLGDGRRGADLSRCPDMHGMNAGGKSHFLIETAQTAALLFKPNEDARKIAGGQVRHGYYADLIGRAGEAIPQLAVLAAALRDPQCLAEVRAALAAARAKPTDWVVWHIDGQDPRLDPAVQEWWRSWRRTDLAGTSAPLSPALDLGDAEAEPKGMVCLLTGSTTRPLATQPKITGLSGVGGLAMGDVMVGFDKAAFASFGLEQSANAAMSEVAAQQYVDGLNDLIRNHSRKLANALVLHWYKDTLPPEDDPLAFLMGMDSEDMTEAAALLAVRRLLVAIRSGERPDLGTNRYFALTLSGAAGRVMVRDWMEGNFEDLAAHIERWFADMSITARDGHNLAPNPKFMAVCGALVRELKDLPAPTAATLWRSALTGLPIPQALMAQALARFRADLVDKDQPPFNHARMGLLRTYFVRLIPGGDPTMTPELNPDHPAPAYHCGRLLALFANLQRAALGDVGAGVVQRYYAAMSQTPGLRVGPLAANARNHLAKLEPKLAWWFENQIAEVMAHLGDGAPRILDLEGQGLFALGYYQQLAALRAGNKPTEPTPDQGEQS